MISHVIGTLSDKSVFGLCGPKSIKLKKYVYFLKWTICRKLINIQVWILKEQNTMYVNNILYFNIVKMFVLTYYPQITNVMIKFLSELNNNKLFKLNVLVGISETICSLLTILYSKLNKNNLYKFLLKNENYSSVSSLSNSSSSLKEENSSLSYEENFNDSNSFNEWLAGVIDGDGCFLLSKKGYASLEITIQLRNIRCLSIIKQKYGGFLKVRANKNHLRYRLHNKIGLSNLITDVNGLIRNPIRLLQLGKICDKYEIILKQPKNLIYYNGWLAGFFDTDGSIYLNLSSDQVFITVAQKNKLLLDPLVKLYGGAIYLSKGKENFKWMVYRKQDILNLLDYFKFYPPISRKFARIELLSKYYELRNLKAHKAAENSVLGKAWKQFLIKWENFNL